jgi:hypothetical protein
MTPSIRAISVTALVVVFSTIAAFSQTAVEYGTIASKSTGTMSGAGGSLAGTWQRVNDSLAGSNHQPAQQPQPQPASQPQVISPPTASPKAQIINISRTSATAIEKEMRVNRQKLETLAGTKGATVHIESVPSKATVYVNNHAIAYTPVDVRLPAGKQVVEVQSPAFLPWKQELSIAGGETIRLEPTLVRDKTQLLVSIK